MAKPGLQGSIAEKFFQTPIVIRHALHLVRPVFFRVHFPVSSRQVVRIMSRRIIMYSEEWALLTVQLTQHEPEHILIMQTHGMGSHSPEARNILFTVIAVESHPVCTFCKPEIVVIVTDKEHRPVTRISQPAADGGHWKTGVCGMV